MITATIESDIERLRSKYYNASVVAVREVHAALTILRVRPDWGRLVFEPGQYTALGLGDWEPTVGESNQAAATDRRVIRRAYSISCSLLDAAGRLVRAADSPYLEFYIALVANGSSPRPRLTPRLFRLKPGNRLYLSPHAHGRHTLAGVRSQDQIVFVATGTGEAPHNALLAELLASGHSQPIVSITCARYRRDLGYLTVHRELARRFSNYRYLTLTTREAENLDPQAPGYRGRRHLQEYFDSGDFERAAGIALDPRRTHVYLCGNRAMIGSPADRTDSSRPAEMAMTEVLQRRGFTLDEAERPGNLHCERFW